LCIGIFKNQSALRFRLMKFENLMKNFKTRKSFGLRRLNQESARKSHHHGRTKS